MHHERKIKCLLTVILFYKRKEYTGLKQMWYET